MGKNKNINYYIEIGSIMELLTKKIIHTFNNFESSNDRVTYSNKDMNLLIMSNIK